MNFHKRQFIFYVNYVLFFTIYVRIKLHNPNIHTVGAHDPCSTFNPAMIRLLPNSSLRMFLQKLLLFLREWKTKISSKYIVREMESPYNHTQNEICFVQVFS